MIILFGSTGFIGKSIRKKINKNIINYNSKNLNLENLKQIKKIAKNFKNSIVIYAAGIKRTKGDNFENFKKNLIIFNNLFQSFFTYTPKKIIFLSSIEVYGEYIGLAKIDEKTKLSPYTNYSLVKIFQEEIIKFFSKKLGYDYAILRLPGVFGNEKKNENIISKLVKSQNKKNKFILNTSGKEKRDYLYVEDISKFIIKLLRKKLNKITLNVVSGNSISINELIKIIEKNFKKKLFIERKISNTIKEYNLEFDNSLIKKKFKSFKFSNIQTLNLKKIFE